MKAKNLENQWLVMQAARDPKTNRRIVETDPKYRREVEELGVQVIEAQKAEQTGPQVNPTQMHGLGSRYWFNRDNPDVKTLQAALGAVNDQGVRHVVANPALRAEIESGLGKVMAGGAEGRVAMSPELSAVVAQVRGG